MGLAAPSEGRLARGALGQCSSLMRGTLEPTFDWLDREPLCCRPVTWMEIPGTRSHDPEQLGIGLYLACRGDEARIEAALRDTPSALNAAMRAGIQRYVAAPDLWDPADAPR